MSPGSRLALAAERGEISLIQLLVAMAISIVMLSAALTAFEGNQALSIELVSRNDAQDRARFAADRLARDLRNLASPTPEQPEAVDAADPYDMVFKTVDLAGPNTGLNSANVKRVRYCLDATDAARAVLYAQTQRWTTPTPPAVPSTTTCPSSAWGGQVVLADHITNRAGGRSRPLFTYNALGLTDISAIHVDLYVGHDRQRPPEVRLSTGIFLRNQNRRPVAAFTATPTAQGIVLNGSASADPEGEPLSYAWFDGATRIGTGVTYTYEATPGTSHPLQLKVFDPAGLEGDAPAQAVTA